MIVSSRTPEGWSNHCPLCNADIVLEPSSPFGDAPCPACGQLLWFLKSADETRLIEPKSGENVEGWIVRLVAEQLGVPEYEVRLKIDDNPVFIEELLADSLDLVELVMMLEES